MIELSEAIKILRKEARMTQKELAESIGFSCSTIKRWEGGVTIPDTAAMRCLIELARSRDVSEQCKKYLSESLSNSRRYTINLPDSALYSVERESICQLVDDSHNAVYVCDMETDEMLYVNRRAAEYIGKPFHPENRDKCYKYIYNRDEPCLQCPKEQMLSGESSDVHLVSPISGRHYHVRGRKLSWNGRPAHAQYFFDETDALETQDGFKNLIDLLGIGVFTCWVYDDGHIQMSYMSEGYFAVVGSSREERAKHGGFGVMNALCEGDRQRVYDKALASARAKRSFCARYHVRRGDGSLVEIYMRAKFVRGDAGKSLFFCSLMDIEDMDRWGEET